MVNQCRYCEDGVAVLGTVCHGLGPTRVYEVITGPCWDCNGTTMPAPPKTFHGWDQASLEHTLNR